MRSSKTRCKDSPNKNTKQYPRTIVSKVGTKVTIFPRLASSDFTKSKVNDSFSKMPERIKPHNINTYF